MCATIAAMITLTTQQIRRLNIHKQRLTKPQPPATADGLLDTVRSLGCLQLDPIRAVERTQYLVLWSRLGNYKRDLLHQVQFRDRKLFEYWAHCASIVLTEHYPLFKHRMQKGIKFGKASREWFAKNEQFRGYIREQMKQKGVLAPADIDDRASTSWEHGGWTAASNPSHARKMLDLMWLKGELAVADRNGLQKQWALLDDWLPEWTPRETLSDYEQTRQAIEVSLKALGAGNDLHIRRHFMRGHYPAQKQATADLINEGHIVQVQTADQHKGNWYVHADDLPLLDALDNGAWKPRTVLLSPFDNLICDRDRTEMLWDFYYRIEIYVPEAKRQYGYYVLPILRGDRLIGRIAPRMDRKKGVLTINGVYAEPRASKSKATTRAIRTQLHKLAKWIGATDIRFNPDKPQDWKLD